MSPFLYVRNSLLSESCQGVHGVLYLLLSVLDDQEPMEGNQYQIVLDRLSKFEGCDGYRTLVKLIGGKVNG